MHSYPRTPAKINAIADTVGEAVTYTMSDKSHILHTIASEETQFYTKRFQFLQMRSPKTISNEDHLQRVI